MERTSPRRQPEAKRELAMYISNSRESLMTCKDQEDMFFSLLQGTKLTVPSGHREIGSTMSVGMSLKPTERGIPWVKAYVLA